MTTTVKRITLALTRQDLKDLEFLANTFNETPSQVIKRGIILLHYITTTRDQNAINNSSSDRPNI